MTTEPSDTRPHFFQNGWYCPKCDKLTEHTFKRGRQICNVCGFALGHPIDEKKEDLKHKISRLTKQIQRQKNDQRKQKLVSLLEKRLTEASEELSKMESTSGSSRLMKFNREQRQG